eukprot:Ihof_evm2s74 gene=Ihof_evmTU2s74
MSKAHGLPSNIMADPSEDQIDDLSRSPSPSLSLSNDRESIYEDELAIEGAMEDLGAMLSALHIDVDDSFDSNPSPAYSLASGVIALLQKSNLNEDEMETGNRILQEYMSLSIALLPADQDVVQEAVTRILSCGMPFYTASIRLGFDENINDEEDREDGYVTDVCMFKDSPVARLLVENMRYYCAHHGLEAILDRILMDKPRLPLPLLKTLVVIVYRFQDFLTEYYAENFIIPFYNAVVNHMLTASTDELKTIPNMLISTILSMLQGLVQRVDPSRAMQIHDRFHLEMAYHNLLSSNLEKRIAGIVEIKEACTSAQTNSNYIEFYRGIPPHRPNENTLGWPWLDEPHMAQWLSDKEILRHIFGPNMHAEILRRSHDIVKFAALYHTLTKDDIDRIWEAAKGQHESVRHWIYLIIPEVAQTMDEEPLLYTFKLMSHMPPCDYDLHAISMVQRFTICAITNLSNKKCQLHPFGLTIYWSLLQDETIGRSKEVTSLALQNLGTLLNWRLLNQFKLQYLSPCLKQIKEGRSVVMSLRILSKIISSHTDPHQSTSTDSQTWEVIKTIEATHKLRQVVIDSLQDYKLEVAKHLSMLPRDTTVDWETLSLNQHTTYLQEVSERLEFLFQILTTRHKEEDHSFMLDLEPLDALWALCMTEDSPASEKQIFLEWIRRLAESRALGDNVPNHLYSVQLPSFQGYKATLAWLRLYWALFVVINTPKLVQRAKILYVKGVALEGLQPLWSTALFAQEDNVGEEARQYLILLTLNLDNPTPQESHDSQQTFIATCMANLAAAAKFIRGGEVDSAQAIHSQHEEEAIVCGPINNTETAKRVIQRCVEMLVELVTEYCQTTNLDLPALGLEPHANSVGEQDITIKLQRMSVPEKVLLTIQLNDTLGHVRKTIAKLLGIEDSSNGVLAEQRFRLIANGKELLMSMDDHTMRQMKITDGLTVHIIMRESGYKPTPRPIGYDYEQDPLPVGLGIPMAILAEERYFDQIFQLLRLGHEQALQIWNLLLLLPTSRHLQGGLKDVGRQLGTTETPPWSDLIDSSSPYSLLYSLQIVNSLVKNSIWRDEFQARGGVQHLLNILLGGAGEGPRKVVTAMTDLLLQVLVYFLLDADWFSKNVSTATHELPRLRTWCLDWMDGHTLIDHLLLLLEGEARQEEDSEGEEGSVARQLVLLLVASCCSLPATHQYFLNHLNLSVWLRSVLLESTREEIRQEVGRGLCLLASSAENSMVADTLLDRMLSFLVDIAGTCTTCEEYFSTLQYLMQHDSQRQLDVDALVNLLTRRLLAHPVLERHQGGQVDHFLVGLCNLLHCLLVQQHLDITESVGAASNEQLIDFIFFRCLFDIPTRSAHGPSSAPMCKTDASRQAALQLLHVLGQQSPTSYLQICSQLYTQHSTMTPSKVLTWSYCPKAWQKAKCGYVGLKNLGCTCYMNSILQQFFMVKPFRSSLLACRIDETQGENSKIMRQLQLIFAHLQESEKKWTDCRNFCEAYQYEGEPVNVAMQMDVDEFFSMLFDKLETLLSSKKPHHDLIKKVFGGKLAQQVISKDDTCCHVSQREEDYFALQCEVKNKRSIQESLELYVEGEKLEGDNKYFCATCEKKVNAVKRTCIKELPPTLMIHMKRFEFDMDQMKRIKVNDYCEFPHQLNMEPYTLEGLAKKEAEANGAECMEEMRDSSYYQYSLYGVLVHTGTADSGHYYSFIKEREPLDPESDQCQWLQFNDSVVDTFNEKDLPAQTFGGADFVTHYDAATNTDVKRSVIKPYSAYMLFYERTSTLKNINTEVEQPIAVRNNSPFSNDQDGSGSYDIMQSIWNENMSFWRDRHVFDDAYFKFMLKIAHEFPDVMPDSDNLDSIDQDYPEYRYMSLVHIKTVSCFFIYTFLRSKDKPYMKDWVEGLHDLYSRSPEGCRWLVQEIIDHKGYISQLLLACPVNEAKSAFIGLLLHVMKLVLVSEEIRYDPITLRALSPPRDPTIPLDLDLPVPDLPIIVELIDCLLDMMKDAAQSWRTFDHYFELLLAIAQLGPEESNLLVSRRAVYYIVDLLLGEVSPRCMPGEKRRKMGDKFGCFNSRPIVTLLNVLITSCAHPFKANSTEQHMQHLSAKDLELLSFKDFDVLVQLLKTDSKCGNEVGMIIQWLCTDHDAYSAMAIRGLVGGVNTVLYDGMPPYFMAITRLLEVGKDKHVKAKVAIFMELFCKVISDNMEFHKCTLYCIDFLHEIVDLHPSALAWLAANIKRWLPGWLLESGLLSSVYSVERLLVKVVQNRWFTEQYNKLHATMYRGPPCDLPPEANLIRHRIYKELLSAMPCVNGFVEPPAHRSNQEGTEPDNMFRLASYFRMLRLTWYSREDKLQWVHQYTIFYALYAGIENLQISMDESKRELMAFWWEMVEGCDEAINEILSHQSGWMSLVECWISLNDIPPAIAYNRFMLPCFYRIIYELAVHSDNFLEMWALHDNFHWALMYVSFESHTYEQASRVLYELLELAAERDIRARILPCIMKAFNKVYDRPSAELVRAGELMLSNRRGRLCAFQNAPNYYINLTKVLQSHMPNRKSTEWLHTNLVLSTLGLIHNWLQYMKDYISQPAYKTEERDLISPRDLRRPVIAQADILLQMCWSCLNPFTPMPVRLKAIVLLRTMYLLYPDISCKKVLIFFHKRHLEFNEIICHQGPLTEQYKIRVSAGPCAPFIVPGVDKEALSHAVEDLSLTRCDNYLWPHVPHQFDATTDTFYTPYYDLLTSMVNNCPLPECRGDAIGLAKLLALETIPISFPEPLKIWVTNPPPSGDIPTPPDSNDIRSVDLWSDVELNPDVVRNATQDDYWLLFFKRMLTSDRPYMINSQSYLLVMCKILAEVLKDPVDAMYNHTTILEIADTVFNLLMVAVDPTQRVSCDNLIE